MRVSIKGFTLTRTGRRNAMSPSPPPLHTHPLSQLARRTDLIEQDVIVEGSLEDHIALHILLVGALPVCGCRRRIPTSDEHGEQAHELAQRGCVYTRHEQLPTPFVPQLLASLHWYSLCRCGGVGGTNLGQPPDK